ncbi:tetratricopeptide repeat protein [Cohnella sp. AR92]|uniref:tetratricopeptide repeat protein n=1 Tax=Cohnella sp. AR92 TaxID=648716 RepID=UPI000F8F5059|nr:tetratricopeptide repeat protein [Cohnella sp. AR92]RUS47110.1 tetratricopeptide repeat protein [Cohnella sp. AR92]
MRIGAAWARWMAVRRKNQGKLEQSLFWYGRIGRRRMTRRDRLDYGTLLHERDRSAEAVLVFNELIAESGGADALLQRALVYNDIGREREAIQDLDEAIRLEPDGSVYWFTRAISYNLLREYEKAAENMKAALDRCGEDSRASTGYELACIYMRLERNEQAAEQLEQVVRQENGAIPLYLSRLSEALEASGREAEALAALRKAARLQSQLHMSKDRGESYLRERTRDSDTAIRTVMSIIDSEYGFRIRESQLLERAGQLAEALEAIEQGLREYPGEELLHLRQGVLYRQLGRDEEAIRQFRQLLEESPDSFSSRMELVLTYRKLGRWEEAIAELTETLRMNPGQTVVRYWLVDVYRDAGRLSDAREASGDLTEAEPEDPLNWKQRAELFIDMERYEEAVAAYTQAIELERTADFFMRRSFAHYMANHYEAAMLDIQEALAIDPSLRGESKTAFALGELYAGMKNFEFAETEYSLAISQEEGNPHLYERRAVVRMKAKRYGAAIEDCRAGLALVPDNARLIWMKSYLHWEIGEYEAALLDAQHYAKLVPDDEQGQQNLATIYSNLHRYDEAIKAINRAIELSPFTSQLYLERASLYYHHRFDRTRASDDLAQWLLYAGAERERQDPLALLDELDGFDDEMRNRAREQYLIGFGTSRYLS